MINDITNSTVEKKTKRQYIQSYSFISKIFTHENNYISNTVHVISK